MNGGKFVLLQRELQKLMKKWLKWMGIAVLSPLLLFIILAALLYLPPVQNWVVQKVTAIASEKTGMEISVGHVNLEWPLDLGINDFRVLHQNDSLPQVKDTIADIRKLVVNVRLLPLFSKKVVIEELSLQQSKINTNGFISDLRIKGEFDKLWLSSNGIDLSQETVEVNGARLSDAHIDITLSDTAAIDTTESSLMWKIFADSLSFTRSRLTLTLPGDTTTTNIWFGKAVARKADINLATETYKVGSLEWRDGSLGYAPMAVTGISLGADSICYSPKGTSLFVRQSAFKLNLSDGRGLQITEMTGGLSLDSAFNHIRMPLMSLRTPDSNIMAEADMDFNVFDGQHPGVMKLRLFAQVGKQDLFALTGQLPQKFTQHFPAHPLIIRGSIDGNMDHMKLTGIDIDLATAVHATLKGTIDHMTDLRRMKADIKIDAKTKSLNFMTALLDPEMSNVIRIPDGITLNGHLTANGTKYSADLTAHEGSGSIRMNGSATIPLDAKDEFVTDMTSYDADISIKDLNVHHFLPKDSIYTLTADMKASGYGTDLLSPKSRLTADARILALQYGNGTLTI